MKMTHEEMTARATAYQKAGELLSTQWKDSTPEEMDQSELVCEELFKLHTKWKQKATLRRMGIK